MVRIYGRPTTNACRRSETGNHTSGSQARHDPTLDTDARLFGPLTRRSAPIWGADGGLRMPTDPTALSRNYPRLRGGDDAPSIPAAEPTLLSEDQPQSADLAVGLVQTPASFPDYDTAMRYFVSEQNLSVLDAVGAIESWQSQGGTFTDPEYLWYMNVSPLIQELRAQSQASTATRSDRGAGSQGLTLVFDIEAEHFREAVASMPPQLRSRVTGLELVSITYDSGDGNE